MTCEWLKLPQLLLAAGAALTLVSSAWGHFPMLEATAPIVEPKQEVRIEYAIGHPYMNDRFDVQTPRSVLVYPPTASKRRAWDLTASITTAGTSQARAWRFGFTPKQEGDWIVAIRCGNYQEPPQRNVEDYAKMVIHVRGAQIGWDRVLGEPMEIVPLTRPYGFPVGSTFRGRVLHRGKPFADGFVEAETYTEVVPQPTPELMEYRREEKTDPNGTFAITLDQPGWWLLSCATDGGPGMQGSWQHRVKRAVFWIYVGQWDPADTRELKAPERE